MQPLDHIPESWAWLPKRKRVTPRTAFVEFATWDVPQTVKDLTQHMLATFNVNIWWYSSGDGLLHGARS